MKQKQFTSLRYSIQEEYGQIQTLCDIIKAANEEKHFKSTQEVFDGITPIMNRYIKRGTIGELLVVTSWLNAWDAGTGTPWEPPFPQVSIFSSK